MNPQQQLSLIEKIIRELDDVKKSQTSVLKKIVQVETENITLSAEPLNDALPDLHQEIDETVQKLNVLQEKFKDYRDGFAKQHPIAPAA